MSNWAQKTVIELRCIAAGANIKGRSKMNKAELLKALKRKSAEDMRRLKAMSYP